MDISSPTFERLLYSLLGKHINLSFSELGYFIVESKGQTSNKVERVGDDYLVIVDRNNIGAIETKRKMVIPFSKIASVTQLE